MIRFVILFLILQASAIFSLNVQANPFVNSRFALVDGTKLHYRIWAPHEKATKGNVLMVHGFSGSTFSWERAADSLARLGYRAVAVDVPPFGFSSKAPRQNQSVTARAQLLYRFLQQEFPDSRWHLAGHSMGGGIVQAMAIMHPDVVESVNFVAATLFSSTSNTQRQVQPWARIPGTTTLVGNIAESWFITPRRITALLFSAFGRQPTNDEVMGYLEPLREPGTARAILNSQRFSHEVSQVSIEQFTVPALAIWGENDTWVPLASRVNVLNKIQGVQLKVIDDAGHNPMETHFEQFMALWLHFLNNL